MGWFRSRRAWRGCFTGVLASTPWIAGVGFTLSWAVGPLSGQSRLEMDLAGSRIQYDSIAPLNAPSLSALAEWQERSLFARVSGSVAGFQNAGWSLQGRGDIAGWLSPFGVTSPLRIEVGGSVGGGRHSSGFDAFLARSDARVHFRGGPAGGWVGASLARARNSFDAVAVNGVVPTLGFWVQSGFLRATLSYQHARVDGAAYPEADLALTMSRGPADLTLYGGVRDSPLVAGWSDRWAGASALFWVTPKAAIVVSGGKYSADVLQGLPGGDFISFGIRVTPRRIRPIPITAPAPIVYTSDEARTGSIAFRVERASIVEIAGDWNGWAPELLSRDGSGRWMVPAGIQPGVYRFNLRVDGERWMVPEGVPSVDDGFGGRVGLLIVSGA